MEFTVTHNDLEYVLTVDWNSEKVINDHGMEIWEVSGWWVTEVDGERIDRAQESEWRERLDEQTVINEISEWEAGQ